MAFLKRRRSAFAYLVSAGLYCGGCNVGVPDASNHVVMRDSAGIEIIESSREKWRADEAWRLADAPSLVIGAADGAAMLLLHNVVGAAVLPNGYIVIGNGGDNTVRLYDSEGRFLRASGGTGRGPGELRGLSFTTLQGSKVFVGASGIIHSYDYEGNLVEASRIPRAALAGVLEDGTFLLRRSGTWPSSREGRWREASTYSTLRQGAEAADSIATLPDITWETMVDLEPSVVVFGAVGYHTVGGTNLFHGWSEQFDIAVLTSSGEVQRRIRRSVAREPVTASDRAAFVDAMVQSNAVHGSSAEQLRRVLDKTPMADYRPAHASIIVDSEGYLWVQRFSLDGYVRSMTASRPRPPSHPIDWDVFTPRGIWLGGVPMPAGLMPVSIGPEFMLGVHYDESDVERLHLYTLTRPPEPES